MSDIAKDIRFSVKIAHLSRIKWRLNENKWKEKISSVLFI